MTIIKANCCKNTYQSYQARTVKKLAEQVPEERKQALAEEISARANLFGCTNERALQLAIAHLNGEKPKRRYSNGRQ